MNATKQRNPSIFSFAAIEEICALRLCRRILAQSDEDFERYTVNEITKVLKYLAAEWLKISGEKMNAQDISQMTDEQLLQHSANYIEQLAAVESVNKITLIAQRDVDMIIETIKQLAERFKSALATQDEHLTHIDFVERCLASARKETEIARQELAKARDENNKVSFTDKIAALASEARVLESEHELLRDEIDEKKCCDCNCENEDD